MVVFLLGIYYCMSNSTLKTLETFTNNPKCPSILIQKGCKIYLKNPEEPEVPGINPIVFDNLGEYVTYMNWQRSKGVTCPVLFLQHGYNTQGEGVYKVQTSATQPQGGLPPSPVTNSITNTNTDTKVKVVNPPYNQKMSLLNAEQDNPPYNQGGAEGYDPSNLYIGKKTPLDAINEKDEGMLYSANPMDSNWGGADYTEEQIKEGKYKGSEVSIQVGQ